MDSTRLGPRRRLTELVTTGSRKRVRDLVRLALGALTLLTLVGFALESHRVCHSWSSSCGDDWGEIHSFLSETGPWPMVVLVLVGLGQWWASRGRMRLAILLAIVNLVLATGVALSFALVHLLSHVDHLVIGTTILPLGLLGMMGVSAAQLVVEPWLAVAERRALERSEPVFPGAVALPPR